MTIKVLMFPQLSSFDNEESGIKRVVEAYHKYVPQHGIEFVDCKVSEESQYDVIAIHAGTSSRIPQKKPILAHLHGLYWSADYQALLWEWKANANVIATARVATIITVPSEWVAESIARDMRVMPRVVGHGLEWDDWQHSYQPGGYVLWNKNRNMDVCNPHAVGVLAEKFPRIEFKTTFAPFKKTFSNMDEIGLQPHDKMKELVQRASIYLSTTKETFGIGTLEALASGVPVLGYAHGGNLEMVEHGVNGYLAIPNNEDDLVEGLAYCVKHHRILSDNARELAKNWGWEKPCREVSQIYKDAHESYLDLQRPFTIDESLYKIA